MNTVRTIIVASVMSLATITQAHALGTRTWISGTGVDQAGCGPVASPCRTLQYAHDNTSAGGEIDIKDSAGYGNIIVSKAISIIGTGSLAGVLASAGGNAITINAGTSDLVILRGLTVEGTGVPSNGIVFNSGGRLDITDCTVQNFYGVGPTIGDGILLQPTSGMPTIVVTRTTASHNGYVGIYYFPPSGSVAAASIVIDGAVTTDNAYGIAITAGNSSAATRASISNSLASKNSAQGFYVGGVNAVVAFDLCGADLNGSAGFYVAQGAVTIGRSRANDNHYFGLSNEGGSVTSYKDNRFSQNFNPTSGTIGTETFY